MRLSEGIGEYSRSMAASKILEFTEGMGPQQYDVVSRMIILSDLSEDVANGMYQDKKLPFGYTEATLEADRAKYEAIIKNNPKIARALEKRNQFMDGLLGELLDRKLLPEHVAENKRYFHHQVLEHMHGERFHIINEGMGGARLAPATGRRMPQTVACHLTNNNGALAARRTTTPNMLMRNMPLSARL
jgi:hypothetical protein